MKKVFPFLIFAGLFFSSCQSDMVGRKAVMPASLETIQTPERFEIVTSLLLLEDSVLTWTNCSKERVLDPNSIEGESIYYDRWTCNTPHGWYKMYKGVLVTNEGNLLDVGFLSKDELTINNLSQNENGTFIQVKSMNNIQVNKIPGYNLNKIFVYEK